MLVFGFILFIVVNFGLDCNLKEKDYINSQYYNETHATLPQATKQCEHDQSMFLLFPTFMTMAGSVICIIAFFPDNPNQKDKGTMPRGWKEP